jgi:hypothetical protein
LDTADDDGDAEEEGTEEETLGWVGEGFAETRGVEDEACCHEGAEEEEENEVEKEQDDADGG